MNIQVASVSWAIMNNALMNMEVHISLWEVHISLFQFWGDIYPEVELLDHMVVLILIFWGTFCFFRVTVPIYLHPRQQYKSSLYIFASTWLFFSLIVVILTGVRLYLILVLICIALMISYVEHLLTFVREGHLYVFFRRTPILFLFAFLIRLFVFFAIKLLELPIDIE